ncbi:hypothetical protein IAR50_001793 [Cryptococcus sp. DSM 104548]
MPLTNGLAPPLTSDEYQTTKQYGDWTGFMQAHALKPWDDDDIGEAHEIVKGLAQRGNGDDDEDPVSEVRRYEDEEVDAPDYIEDEGADEPGPGEIEGYEEDAAPIEVDNGGDDAGYYGGGVEEDYPEDYSYDQEYDDDGGDSYDQDYDDYYGDDY